MTGGVDLTFAIVLTASSKGEFLILNSTTDPYFASGPLIPTFARAPAGMGCEGWSRTTGERDQCLVEEINAAARLPLCAEPQRISPPWPRIFGAAEFRPGAPNRRPLPAAHRGY